MENILYLDDYINLYNKKNHLLIISKPYKNTLKNGVIGDRLKFIKKFQKIMDGNNLGNSFLSESLSIIVNNLYTEEDKLLIKEVMEELNYKPIKFIQEIDYIKVNKDTIYINYNYSYFYFVYTNHLGNIEINLYKNDDINKLLIGKIVSLLNKKDLIIYGKNIKELENILKKENIEYYLYEESDNLLIKILLHNKIV